ncbi:MAG: phytase [Bacteroidota bacterium]
MKDLMCVLAIAMLSACVPTNKVNRPSDKALKPVIITEPTPHDTDDPAIWIHPSDPSKSLIVGTDKDKDGGLYVFDLKGKIQKDKLALGLKRPNNVDIEYGLQLGDTAIDIAVTTERLTHKLRVFQLPNMNEIDGGGFPVFEGEEANAPMGVAIYKEPISKRIFAFVGRKTGPKEGYLWQYELKDNGQAELEMVLVRKLGAFSGTKEIEAIAVDDQLGYVYYADEGAGLRQYYAHPDSSTMELALFGQDGFAEDREGISILPINEHDGYILVSDQQANAFRVFSREGMEHAFVTSLPFSTNESDGSDLTVLSLNETFSEGLFVAMSDDRTFQYYRLKDILSRIEASMASVD